MSSFNKVILVGRLTQDPEIKYTPQGTQIAKFGLAVNRTRSKNDETDFFTVVAWQKLAEICGQYLKKGKLVLIEGEIHSRRYETQDGQKRTAFEVTAQNMQMLGGRGENGTGAPGAPASGGYSSKPQDNEGFDKLDEINIDEFDAEDMPF